MRRLRLIFIVFAVFVSRDFAADSLNVRIVGDWPYGTLTSVAECDSFIFAGLGGGFGVYKFSQVEIWNSFRKTGGWVTDLERKDSLLVVADRITGLHLYSISNPVAPQEIGSINDTGVQCLYIAGDSLLVGGEGFVRIYNISDPTFPICLLDISVAGKVTALKKKSDLIYVAQWGYGVFIYGLNNGEFEQVSSINNIFPTDILVKDTLLFIADIEGKISIYSIADPENPQILSLHSTYHPVGKLALYQNLLYFTNADGGVGLLDVTQPENPVLLSGVTTSTPAVDLTFQFDFVAIGTQSALIRVDYSDPSEPLLVDSADVPYVAISMDFHDTTLYLHSLSGKLWILDISDPEYPYLAGFINTGGSGVIKAVDSSLYVGNESRGLQVYSISSPSYPVLLMNFDSLRFIKKFLLVGDTLYVLDEQSGILIYDVSISMNPQLITSFDVAPGAVDFGVSDSIIAVISRNKGLYIYNKNTSELLSVLNLDMRPNHIVLDEGYALTTLGSSGVEIFNIEDPFAPYLISRIEIDGYADGLTLFDSLLAVACGNGGVQIFDISDVNNPYQTAYYTGLGWIKDITKWQDYIVSLNSGRGITIYELTSTGVEENGYLDGRIKILYPNPTSGVVYLNVNVKKLSVFDLSGRRVPYVLKGKMLDISRNPTGFYIIKLKDRSVKVLKIR